MKIQKPKLPEKLLEVFDFVEMLQEAKENEMEIEEKHIKGAYLVEEDITGVRFSNVLFENVRFMECNFEKCTFIDVVFKNSDLSNSNLSQTYFNRCQFVIDKVLGAKFNEAVMKDVFITESNFEYANFNGVKLNVAKFTNSNFESANLTDCKLKNLTCEKVEFINTSFFKTPLKGIDFTNSTITGMVVSNDGVELKGAIVDLYQAAELAKLFGIVIK